MEAESKYLAAFCSGEIENLEPEMLTGERRVVAAVLMAKGRPASREVLSLWMREAKADVDLSWYGMDIQEGELVEIDDGLLALMFRRRIAEGADRMRRLARDGPSDLEDQARAVYDWVLEPAEKQRRRDPNQEAHEWVKSLIAGKVDSLGHRMTWSPLLSSGLGPLGKYLMLVVAGREGSGKSSLTFRVALDLAEQGARVLYVSPDMQERKCLVRVISLVSGIPFRKVWGHAEMEPTLTLFEQDKAEQARQYVDLLPLLFSGERNILRVYNKVKMWGADVVVLDYAALFRSPNVPVGDILAQEQVTATAHMARRIADRAFVCLVSQVKIGSVPDAENIGWSGEIKNVADAALWISKDGYYVECQTVKNRGPYIKVVYYMYGPLMYLIELPVHEGGISIASL